MLRRYVVSLIFDLVVLSALCSTLPYVTRAQVRAGTAVDETWACEFTLDNAAAPDRSFRVDEEMKAQLAKGIGFVGSGPVRIVSANVEITPKDVSWKENKTDYTAPGAGMVARVKWDTPTDAANGAGGRIQIEFPKLAGVGDFVPSFHSGSYQHAGDGAWVFREIRGYRDTPSLLLGRFVFALAAGLPIALVFESIRSFLRFRKQQRDRQAGPASKAQTLPRTFYPSPTAELEGFTATVFISGALGCLFVGIEVYAGYMSSVLWWVIVIMQCIGLAIGVIVAWIVRVSVVTVHIDDDAVSYARGRGEPKWMTSRWADLRGASVKSRTYRGTRTEWLELEFPDGRKRKISDPMVRGIVLANYAKHHPAA